MLNRVTLIGRLVRDPEVRQTSSGKSVASFTVAVDRRFKADGQPQADFFRVKAWGQSADYVGNHLAKGRLVAIDGRLEVSAWNDKDGNKREQVETFAENVQGLDRPKDGPVAAKAASVSNADDFDPFAEG